LGGKLKRELAKLCPVAKVSSSQPRFCRYQSGPNVDGSAIRRRLQIETDEFFIEAPCQATFTTLFNSFTMRRLGGAH